MVLRVPNVLLKNHVGVLLTGLLQFSVIKNLFLMMFQVIYIVCHKKYKV